MENSQNYVEKGVVMLMEYLPDVILAIIVLILGFWIIRLIIRMFNRGLEKSQVYESLKKFLGSLIGVLLKIMLLISVASILGIATTSFVAVLGAAGLAVGLALQGSLTNFAGGAF